jgi:AraC-like DNA-binding protein
MRELTVAAGVVRAFRLGFAEPASFSRAFKRWTGASTVEVRRKKPSSSRALE